ncbi:MAG: hypothetical protein KC944_15780 [Candidatus Omnitrophica bacterium]|nr:hypothetical protein [Candidatus Omnitrophota bacterium]
MLRVKVIFSICLLAVFAVAPVAAQQPLASPLLAGFVPVVPEQGMEINGVQNGGNWEPYCDAFGDGTLAAASIREELPGNTPGTEAGFIFMADPNNQVQIVDGFYTETNFPNDPWNSNNDVARASGNPARIGCDRTPGGTSYMFANEATPWAFGALFPNFSPGMNYTAQMATVQLFNRTGFSITPAALAEDPKFVPGDTGPQTDQDRFGGDVIGLSNGGYSVIVEARSTAHSPTGDRWRACTIYDSSGNRVTGPFNANIEQPTARTTGWSNMAAYNGGWADYPSHENTQNTNGQFTMQFWNNDGTPQGTWPYILRAAPGDPLAPAGGITTSISDGGGQGGARIRSHPASNYVYYVGRGFGVGGGANAGVYITKIDATTRQTVGEAFVSDTFDTAVERVMAGVDANDNIFVCWAEGATNQMIGRLYDDTLAPVTDAFFCFQNSNNGNFTTRRPSCAMADDGRILITGRFEGQGATSIPAYANSFDDDQVAIVIQIPQPIETSDVENWKLLD